jgi:serine/threonine protein kinase
MSLIPLDLRDIALESDLLPGDSPATIRIRARPSSRGGELLWLHPEELGTYARVFLGRLRQAGAWRSVAIKLQRDEVASDFAYDHQLVSAKFDEELANHLDLQRGRSLSHHPRSGALHTVRLLPRPAHHRDSGSAPLPASEVLPPCLFCLRGRHALRLLGRDGKPLQQGPPSGSQRYLEPAEDDGCRRRYYSDHLDDVALATVGRDPSACASCALRGGQNPQACLANLRYVNLFENRILFFEPLDLSLHDALRWWQGERRPLASRPRRSLRAIEARMLRLRQTWGRSDDREEAVLRGLLELRLRIDLFQQTLRGVESLHARGIPHLDINPENICLKVRAGRVEVRLIDLGMAANPKFTARDQYEKRLWPRRADFAAEECQRLSSFSSRHLFVRVAPGRLAARIPVCRGDQLAYESPGPLRRMLLFEVVAVVPGEVHIPGFGTFPDSCEVAGAPNDPATPAALKLTIIPQRGLAADIFSLGMVLASLLFHEISGDGLRRELGKIEEGLFSHWSTVGPDPQPIPGRVLVRRALSRPDDHSRWFRERVEALGIYAEATPLAEELLGIALRCVLRCTHHFPYLADRGGDARLALQRLAADVRAVRRALEEDLLGIRYGESLSRRRAALRQLAAHRQIPITPVLPQPISDACDVERTEGSAVQEAVRMIAADSGRADVEIRRLADLRLSPEHVAELVQNLDPILDSLGPKRFAATRSLWSFLEWLHRPDPFGDHLRQLLEDWESVRSESGPGSRAAWQDHEWALATRLAAAWESYQLVDRALATYDQRIGREINQFWRKALARYRIAIRAEDCGLLERGRDALDRLEESRVASDRHAEELQRRFEIGLQRWRDLGGQWARAWLDELTREATAYWTIQLPESQVLWSRSRAALIARLRAFFEVLGGAMASARVRAQDRILILSTGTCVHLREARTLIPAAISPAPILGPAFEAEADSILRRHLTRR